MMLKDALTKEQQRELQKAAHERVPRRDYEDRLEQIRGFCRVPRTAIEIAEEFGYTASAVYPPIRTLVHQGRLGKSDRNHWLVMDTRFIEPTTRLEPNVPTQESPDLESLARQYVWDNVNADTAEIKRFVAYVLGKEIKQ